MALCLRAIAIVISQGLGEDFLGSDDDLYFRLAADIVSGRDGDWDAYTSSLAARTRVHVQLLRLPMEVFGPNRLVANFVVATVGSVVAGGTAWLATRLTAPRVGLIAGGIVAALPSQVAWSTTTMKDPVVWLTGVTAVAAFITLGFQGHRWFFATAATAAGLLALGFTRNHSVVVLAWGLVAAALWLTSTHGWRPVASAIVLLLTVPILTGSGVAGAGLILETGSPADARVSMARGADSAVVSVPETPTPEVTTVTTLEEDPVDETPRDTSSGWVSEVAHLPKGYSVVLLQPYPWHPRNDLRFVFSKVDTVLWYPVLLLAGLGSYVSLQRRSIASVLVAIVALTATVLALFEGNLGTAFRHRGELVWGCAILAGIGIELVVNRSGSGLGLRRHESAT